MSLYAFDGTNDNDENTGSTAAAVAADTNVYRFYSAYSADVQPAGVHCDYVPGVGTRFGLLGKIVGGAFGVGWDERIEEAYAALCAAYVAGDTTIDVIGFSRGAAMALNFVNTVDRKGIVHNGQLITSHPVIRFVGVFDVVDAFGIANLGGPLGKVDPLHSLDLPASVQHCFHAMALDERRPSFENHRIPGAYEVWFRGVHSDIGGGNNNPDLEYVAGRWMLRKAIACGLPVSELNIQDSAVHPEARIQPNVFSKVSPLWRTVMTTDLIHYAVAQHVVLPGEDCKVYPSDCPIETLAFEKGRLAPPDSQAH